MLNNTPLRSISKVVHAALRTGSVLLVLLCLAPLAFSDFVVTRGFSSATNAEFERVLLTEVTRNGSTITTGTNVMLNGPLADRIRVWGMVPVADEAQVVYGAFDPNDTEALDALYVVNLRTPGVPKQLSGQRSAPADEVLIDFAGNGSSARIVYVVRNSRTNTDTLLLADTRNPGSATVVATLNNGDQIGNELEVSPDGSTVAYSVDPISGSRKVAVTFLNRPANTTDVYTNPTLSNYSAVEFAFSDDSSRLFWIDTGASDEPGPLQAVTLNALDGTFGTVQRVNAANLVDERVSEFAIKPGTNDRVAYRGFAAGSSAPSDTYLANLATPGSVTKLNNGPFNGAAFTTWEDVLWRGDNVLYNSTEDLLLRADLFSVADTNPGNTALLSRQVPFSTQRDNKAAGISHFVQSPNDNRTAMIDGDPALNLFVIDRFNIGASAEPFTINSARSLDDITDPGDRPPQFNPGSDMLAMVIREELSGQSATENLYVASATSSNSDVAVLSTPSPQVFQHFWFAADAVTSQPPTAMAAAVLPASRSGQVGTSVTAFVTLLNGGSATAEGCSIDLIENIPATLDYQTTNPATNAPTGLPNTPIDIPGLGSQSFLISLSLDAEFSPVDAQLAFSCRNADTITPLTGLNTLLLSASNSPVADVVALAATASMDGIVRLDGAGNGAFSVASVNVGASATLDVSASTTTGASVALCQTNPATGACTNPLQPTTGAVEVTVGTNGTPTFSIFTSSASTIPADAANNRLTVVYRDSGGRVRGQTSVAIQSSP